MINPDPPAELRSAATVMTVSVASASLSIGAAAEDGGGGREDPASQQRKRKQQAASLERCEPGWGPQDSGRGGGVAPGDHPSRQPGFMETVSAGDCTQHVGHLPAGDTPQEVMGQEAWAITQVSVDEGEGRGDVQDKISPQVSLRGPRYLAESYSGVSGAVSI